MPDDDFEERLRRSAGIPTNAAEHALAVQKAEHEAEWDRDEPFRKDLFVRYAERIYPIIHSTPENFPSGFPREARLSRPI
jgi:hypothetical protein